MSEKTNKRSDQAKELKQIFDELQQNEIKNDDLINDDHHKDTYSIPKIDVLNLPPRKEVHSKNSRTRLSISRPFLRFLSIIMLIVVIIVGAYFIWGEELITLLKDLK